MHLNIILSSFLVFVSVQGAQALSPKRPRYHSPADSKQLENNDVVPGSQKGHNQSPPALEGIGPSNNLETPPTLAQRQQRLMSPPGAQETLPENDFNTPSHEDAGNEHPPILPVKNQNQLERTLFLSQAELDTIRTRPILHIPSLSSPGVGQVRNLQPRPSAFQQRNMFETPKRTRITPPGLPRMGATSFDMRGNGPSFPFQWWTNSPNSPGQARQRVAAFPQRRQPTLNARANFERQQENDPIAINLFPDSDSNDGKGSNSSD